MRLRTTTTGALIGAAATAAAFALAGPALPAKPAQGAYVAKCNKLKRSAAFLGTMRQVKDSERMWMRFTLFERILPDGELQPVEATGLDTWRKSRPGVERFSFRQRVRSLAEAAVYRVEVEFRWLDADEQPIRQAFETSGRCRQPGALPNLHVQNIRLGPDGRYRARVVNSGRDVATAPAVQLFVDGQESGLLQLPDIPPAEFEVARFDGPLCIGSVQAVADPAALVRESAEDDNALTESCASLQDRAQP